MLSSFKAAAFFSVCTETCRFSQECTWLGAQNACTRAALDLAVAEFLHIYFSDMRYNNYTGIGGPASVLYTHALAH